ncbi:hypothetical protein ACFGOO_09905 [Treponema vincentii]|uniref:hypothetical protein n=1 Tax=Treponema vincentii TaxID=69710 RepID=UPI0035F5597C
MTSKITQAELTAAVSAIRAELKVRHPAYRFSVMGRKTEKAITIALMKHPIEQLTNEQLMSEWFTKAPDSLIFFDYTTWDLHRKQDVNEAVFMSKIAIQCRNNSAFSTIDHFSTWLNPVVLQLFNEIQKKAGKRVKIELSIGRTSRDRVIPSHYVARTAKGRRLPLF